MPSISNLTAVSSVNTTDLVPVVQTPGAANNPKKATIAQMIAAIFANIGSNIIAVVNGGTGASTASGARTNLGSGATGDALFTSATAASARTTLGAGATGDSLFTSATAAAARSVLGGGNLLGMQVFTASGTYTPTSGTNFIVVEVQAPGGGSGGCTSTAAGQFSAGNGGAGGGYGLKRITSGFSGTTVTIGAVGAAGAAGNNAGGTGGTTSFGAFLSCTGGAGGLGCPNTTGPTVGQVGYAAAGGTATGADFSKPGSTGGISIAVSAAIALSASGGDSCYGAGGKSAGLVSNNTSGQPGTGYGGGGSGSMNINGVFSAQSGAAGAPGIVIVWEYA